jgi:hypothetical protein
MEVELVMVSLLGEVLILDRLMENVGFAGATVFRIAYVVKTRSHPLSCHIDRYRGLALRRF